MVEHLAKLSGNDPTLFVLASRLVGTVSAALSDGDPAHAADIAGYDAQYNYLNHIRPSLLALSEKERFEAAVAACEAGDTSACRTRNELVLLSQERDQALAQACFTDLRLCNTLTREAREMGNVVYRDTGFVWANSPDPTFALNLATMGSLQPNPALAESWHYRQANDLSDGLLIGSLLAGTTTGVNLAGRAILPSAQYVSSTGQAFANVLRTEAQLIQFGYQRYVVPTVITAWTSPAAIWMANPANVQNVTDFVLNVTDVDPTPPTSAAGLAGSLIYDPTIPTRLMQQKANTFLRSE